MRDEDTVHCWSIKAEIRLDRFGHFMLRIEETDNQHMRHGAEHRVPSEAVATARFPIAREVVNRMISEIEARATGRSRLDGGLGPSAPTFELPLSWDGLRG